MIALPFIIPENDNNVRLARLLILIEALAFSKRGKLLLSLEKIAIYDHLVKNPVLLQRVLNADGQGRLLDLNEEEVDSIESHFPNRSSLYDFQPLKNILYSLFYYQYISAEHDKKGHIFYYVTDKGREFTSKLETPYLIRVKELTEVLASLQKFTPSQLQKTIKSINYGVLP